jgi:hypothetical protein
MYVLLIVACPFVLFLLDIVLSVLLRYTDCDCPFGIFKLVFPLIIKKYELKVGILLNIEEEQTTQCPKEKVQRDKQQSTKHTYKAKDRVTQTPLKTGELSRNLKKNGC